MQLIQLLDVIESEFSFLFVRWGFNVVYKSENLYPPDIRIGLASKKYNFKILFLYQRVVSLYIGSASRSFEDEGEWLYFRHFVDFILKRPLRWHPLHLDKPYKKYVLDDLIDIRNEFMQFNKEIFKMFRDENALKEWEPNFRSYVREEIQRKIERSK